MFGIATGTACPRNDGRAKGGGDGLRIGTAGFETAHGLYFAYCPVRFIKHAVPRRARMRRRYFLENLLCNAFNISSKLRSGREPLRSGRLLKFPRLARLSLLSRLRLLLLFPFLRSG